MSIGAVFKRELTAIARRGGEPWGRFAFAGVLLIVVLGVFASFYDQVDGLSIRLMAEAAERAFAIVLAVHLIAIFDAVGKSSRCIAVENDRRTLDFLLSTRLSNAEIVLGKLGACLAAFLGTVAAGLPIVLLLHRLGGVDLRLILLSYAAIASLGIFLSCLSIWISATSPNARTASARAILYIFGWLWGPFAVAVVLPRLGLRPPGWVSVSECVAPGVEPSEFLHELARARSVAIARRCGRADVRAATGLRPGLLGRGDPPVAVRLSRSGRRRVAERGPPVRLLRSGDPGRRSATTRSSGESGSPGGRRDSCGGSVS